jgi:sialic acid synthase SpsE
MNFNIRGKNIGQGHPPYIIAEMACAHDGDPDKAIALIDAAAEAGVDAVQLQLFRADQQVLPDHIYNPFDYDLTH